MARLTVCLLLGTVLLGGCGAFLYDREDIIGPLPPDRPLIRIEPDGNGLFANSYFRITISGSGSVIRYTTNGSDPRTAGLTYALPVTLSGTQPLVILAVDGNGTSSWSKVASNYVPFADGSAARPWLVASGRHLSNVRHRPADHFLQVAEIDLSNVNWTPIGDVGSPFTGHYTAMSNFGISGLAITTTGPDSGLFGRASGSTFSNILVNGLRLQTTMDYAGGLCGYAENNAVFSGCRVVYAAITNTGGIDTGGLVGFLYDSSKLINCSFLNGTVHGQRQSTGGLVGHSSMSALNGCWISQTAVYGSTNVGGLAGMFTDSSTMERCYTAKSFMIPCHVSGQQAVGGLVGAQAPSWISNSFSFSTVTANVQRGGGLVGYMSGAHLSDSYSVGPVNGSGSQLGGLVGTYTNLSTLTRCYAAGPVVVGPQTGAFAGSSSEEAGVRSFCYANTNTSGITNLTGAGSTDGVYALSTAQMMVAANFGTFLIGEPGSVWIIDAGTSYPYLQWQPSGNVPGPP